jgi:hypothetical protein
MKPWDIYLNLHKDCFSLLNRKTGRVESHDRMLVAGGVDFIVQPAGLRLAREHGKKKPHAFIRARVLFPLSSGSGRLLSMRWKQVTYNPMKEGRWVLVEDRNHAVSQASMVVCRHYSGFPEVWVLEAA